MASDLLQVLWEATLALTVALVFVLCVRVPLRHLGGATVLRWPWVAALLAPAATLLPAPVVAPVEVQLAPLQFIDAAPAGIATEAAVASGIAWAPWLLAAWVLGALLFAFACVLQQRRFERSLGTLARQHDGTWRAQSAAGTPAVLGLVSPRIVLPADFERRFAPAERDLALAHERAHRAARDTWIAAIAATLRCVFWFNPLVHVATRCLRLDQEYACDATVLAAHPQRRRSYAEALLKAQPGLLLPLGCQWDAGRPLLARVRQLAAPLPGAGRRGAARALAAVFALCAATVAWALQPARADDARWIEARITLQPKSEFGVDAPAAAAPSHVVVRDGGSFAVSTSDGHVRWELTGVPRFDADGQIHLDAQLRRDGETILSHSNVSTPGQPLALRSALAEDGIGATATIALWPARDASVPPRRGGEARATGRARVSVDGRGETAFFDHGLGDVIDAVVPDDTNLTVSYRVTELTATQATVAIRIARADAGGADVVLSTPSLVVERGTDAQVRMDVPVDDFDTAGGAAPGTSRQVDIRITVDKA